MDNQLHIQGCLSKADIKKYAEITRSAGIGPMGIYYAGILAPIISSAVSAIAQNILSAFGFSDFIVMFLALICAAMAGLTWFILLMRLANRYRYGRGTEMRSAIRIAIQESGVTIDNDTISTHIQWRGISKIKNSRRFLIICVADGEDVIIPSRWFPKRHEKKAFYNHLLHYKNFTETHRESLDIACQTE